MAEPQPQPQPQQVELQLLNGDELTEEKEDADAPESAKRRRRKKKKCKTCAPGKRLNFSTVEKAVPGASDMGGGGGTQKSLSPSNITTVSPDV